jgi:hypothetical protein
MEEQRIKHEREMRERQYEHERIKQERSERRKLADKVAKWEDANQPAA